MKNKIQIILGKLFLTSFMLFAVMVYGCNSNTPSNNTVEKATNGVKINNYPEIEMILPEYTAIERTAEGRFICFASDPDGDSLTYKWTASRGKITGNEFSAVYTAPSNFVDVIVTVSVSDGRGGTVEGSVALPVVCCSNVQRNPEWFAQ